MLANNYLVKNKIQNGLLEASRRRSEKMHGQNKNKRCLSKSSNCVHRAHRTTKLNQSLKSNDETSNELVQQVSPYSRMTNNPGLVFADALSIVLFAALGKTSHSSVVDGGSGATIEFILSVLFTALPFLISWFTITPLLGCYDDESKEKLSETVLKGWAVSIPIGIVLRGLIKGYVPPTPFIIVTMISTLVIIGIGRFGHSKLMD